METKQFPLAEFKVINSADEPGTFEALVAVFGNVDHGGDRIKRGAFKRTLEERGLPPIVWSHNWETPPIGTTLEAVENNDGLRIKGRLFVGEGEDAPVARAVYTAMKAKDGQGRPTLREFSFGYQAMKSTLVEEDGEQVRELEDIELFEAGPTLVGMNDSTRHLGIKTFAHLLSDELGQQASQRVQHGKQSPNPSGEEADARTALSPRIPFHLPVRS